MIERQVCELSEIPRLPRREKSESKLSQIWHFVGKYRRDIWGGNNPSTAYDRQADELRGGAV